jgi:hypothetical protein
MPLRFQVKILYPALDVAEIEPVALRADDSSGISELIGFPQLCPWQFRHDYVFSRSDLHDSTSNIDRNPLSACTTKPNLER